jgi:hypothetical protein
VPSDEPRATGDQALNDARQNANDAMQGRNDAQASSSRREQARTNADQATTNSDQGDTNTAQGLTNDAQGETNAAQAVANETIHETIRLLHRSVDALTVSMEAVSASLEENSKIYARLTVAEDRTKETARRATAIEVQSNARAGKFMRLWVTLLLVVVLVGGGGFALNAYRTRQLCEQRNDANLSNSTLIQDALSRLPAESQARASYMDFLARSVQIDCNRLF